MNPEPPWVVVLPGLAFCQPRVASTPMHLNAVIAGAPREPWSLRVEPFGSLLAIGLVLGILLAMRLARQSGLAANDGVRALVAALAASLVGARLVYLLGVERVPLRDALAVGQGGLSGYGALFGGTLAALIVLWRLPQRAAWLDVGALGALVAIVFGRLGCQIAGSDFGRALGASAPRWLVRLGSFARPSSDITPVWFVHTLRGNVNEGSLTTPPLHPTALYEAFGALLLLGALLSAWPRQRQRGQSFVIAVLALGALRFGVDGLRDEAERGKLAGFSIERAAALVSVLAVAVAFAWAAARRAQRPSSN